VRIDSQFGIDTGEYLVDVFLESDEEAGLDEDELRRRVATLMRASGLGTGALDLFFRVRNGQGEWVAATRNEGGKLVPVPW
jgi:hypothetical protein